jgi:DNA polymerase-3 subunit gamma/tau
MAYQVLARKWRPRYFPEMVGQTHVVRALTNALDNNRLHHAYLFTGTRGVGKTTIARIFAKSLNCETGVTAYPCGKCSSCCEVNEGRFVDLIEVDAASRTKVEDTRDLLDNVQYAPTRGRYKVYLIDEVHMLSTHSFNALLKTLEEPPSHVKFILATTDPQKLPPTILSRCLQFNLKRLPIEQIQQHLQTILEKENIPSEVAALNQLAQAADGSMRDALSLLDQAIAYGAGKLLNNDVSSMLGTMDQNLVLELVKRLAQFDAAAVLEQVANLSEQNPDFVMVLADILSLLQAVALAQVVQQKPNIDNEQILQLATQLSAEDVQLFYQIALLGRRDLPLAPDQRGGFEMLMLRMLAFRPNTITVKPTATPVPTPTPTPTPTPSKIGNEWHNIINELGLKAVVRQLALQCELRREGNTWNLILSSNHKHLLGRKKKLEDKIKEKYGESQIVNIGLGQIKTETAAVQEQRVKEDHTQYVTLAIDEDPFVVFFKEKCGARISNIEVI